MKALGRRHPALAIGLIVAAVYALVAWDRMAGPSPQFHFVDLAQSFLDGRLDTDTPNQRSARTQPDDPQGYRAAIKRSEASGGWNDWASIRTLTLSDGQVVRGRFPWSGDTGEKRHLFHTSDGYEMKIVVPQDLARTCGERGNRLCDERDHYVSFPPFPAIAMLPFVAVMGYDTPDVLLTILCGGLNALLLFQFLQLLAQRGHSKRTTRENMWLTVAFAFGSVAFFSSVRGEVWFTALVFGIALNIGYMICALDLRRPILAGILLACAFATRVPIAFCVMFFAWQLFFPGNRWVTGRWREILVTGAKFAAPVVAMGVLIMLYNAARFDDPAEFGHAYLSGGAGERIRDHGMFNTYYLNGNLAAAFVNLPQLIPHSPYLQITKHGLSMLATTPILFLLLRPRDMPPLRRALWLAIACAAVPGLLYQNSGWEQFGYRFALDYFPYLIALLAIGGRPITRRVQLVIAISIAVNLFGAITFGRFGAYYYG